MLVAWVVKIVKSCCINSTFSLVSAQPARGKLLSANLIQSFSVFSPELLPRQWLSNSIEGPSITSLYREIRSPLSQTH